MPTFWVIERYLSNKLHFWNAGQASENASSDELCGGWTTSIHDAAQFRRDADAQAVLYRLLRGAGRTAEHGMIAAP